MSTRFKREDSKRVSAGMSDLFIRKTPLKKKTVEFVRRITTPLADERTEIGGIGLLIYGLHGIMDGGGRQLEGLQSGFNLPAPPPLVLHFVMDVGTAETTIVQKALIVQILLDENERIRGCPPLIQLAPHICGTVLRTGAISLSLIKCLEP